MRKSPHELVDASDEREARLKAIREREEMETHFALKLRREEIRREDRTVRILKDATTEEKHWKRRVLLEKMRDPVWWAGQVFQPKRIALVLFVGFLWWLISSATGR